MVLPTNVSTAYPDDNSDPSVRLHQQHHDIIHAAVNAFMPVVVQTSAEWSDSTQVLLDGQIGIERKPDRTTALRFGDGVTQAKDLPKFDPVRKGELLLNVRDFGAKGDGTTDDTAAFTAAVNHANSLNPRGTDAANVNGILIFLPQGRYRLTGAVTPILRSGVNFAGSSENGTVLLLEHNGATFTWGNGSNFPVGGGMSSVKIEYVSTPGSSSIVFDLPNVTRLRFSNLMLVNVAQLARLGVVGATAASTIDFFDLRGYTNNSGRSVLLVNNGAGLTMTKCQLFVGGVVAPKVDRTSVMTTVPNTNLISVVGPWDLIQITACIFERYYRGIYAEAGAGVVINNWHISTTYFDYHRDSPIYLVATTSGYGAVISVNVENCWLASWEGDAVALNGPGLIRGVTLIGCVIPSAGSHGVKISAGCRDVDVDNCRIMGTNRLNINAHGIAVFGGSHLKLTKNISGYDSAWAGFAWQPYAGIYVTAGVDHYQITGADLAGSKAGLVEETHKNGSKNRLVKDNIGTNYSGAAAITLPASRVAWTNTQGTTSTVHIHSGRVTAIAKNGTPITGMTAGSLVIHPGESFTTTYSVAPSVTRFVHP